MYEYSAKITRVIDGDTVEASVDLGFTVSINTNFRLFGIDTPELHSTNANERELAKKAKARLMELIEGKTVTIKSYKADKYGRWLAEIKSIDATISPTVNTQLILEGLAKAYFGIGEKPNWS